MAGRFLCRISGIGALYSRKATASTAVKAKAGLPSLFRLLTSVSSEDPVAQGIREKLVSELEATHVELEDTSGGCGSFFRVKVVSPQFDGMSRIKQHRLVNDILAPEIAQIHGLTVTTKTTAQFEKEV